MDCFSFIAHHGIKGQQWHHRRWQNEDGSLTPEGYIHYGVKPSKKTVLLRFTNSAGYKAAKNQYKELSSDDRQVVSRKPLSKEEKKNLGITNYIEKGGTLKKGSKLYRTASEKDDQANKIRYFSTSEYDAEKWSREFVPQIAKRYGVNKDLYSVEKNIKIASAAKLGEEWEKLWIEKNGKTSLHDLIEGKANLSRFQYDNVELVEGGYGFQGDKVKYDPYAVNYSRGEKFVKSQSKKLRDLAASNIMMETFDKNRSELISRLKKQGYGGVADINGIDVSYDPIIIFDTNTYTKKVSSIRYSDEDIKRYDLLYNSLGGDKKYTEIKNLSPATRAGKKAIAKSMRSSGRTVDQIAVSMGLTVGEVDGLLYGDW